MRGLISLINCIVPQFDSLPEITPGRVSVVSQQCILFAIPFVRLAIAGPLWGDDAIHGHAHSDLSMSVED